MSRTIRRKNGHNRNEIWYMYDSVYVESKYGGEYLKKVYYEGKDKLKGLAKYHGDSYVDLRICDLYTHSSRQLQHKIHRARARHELTRYKKDNEYEVMIRKNPHLNYWH